MVNIRTNVVVKQPSNEKMHQKPTYVVGTGKSTKTVYKYRQRHPKKSLNV